MKTTKQEARSYGENLSETTTSRCSGSELTGMERHGSVRSQLSSQFTPLLKERMLGEKGVKVRSWSFHCPNNVTI